MRNQLIKLALAAGDVQYAKDVANYKIRASQLAARIAYYNSY